MYILGLLLVASLITLLFAIYEIGEQKQKNYECNNDVDDLMTAYKSVSEQVELLLQSLPKKGSKDVLKYINKKLREYELEIVKDDDVLYLVELDSTPDDIEL
jgi:cell division protein FtsB